MTTLRPYTESDREAALALLRRHVQRSLTGESRAFTVHPGDWDWWMDHPDPRVPPATILLDDDTLVERGHDGMLVAFTSTPQRLADVLTVDLPAAGVGPVGVVSSVADDDLERGRVLTELGFAPDPSAEAPVFLRPLTGDLPEIHLPAGYTLREVTDADAESRADAARLAFASTMDASTHRARYRRFMASPGYTRAVDLAAVAPDGSVAAFAIVWPDDELGLGQFEPVGTHPEHVRLGLGRAVVVAGTHQLQGRGMKMARVTTNADRTPAIELYRRCGFEQVQLVRDWSRPTA